MPIDTSIYGNIKPTEAPDVMGSVQKAMTLSQLGMQQMQAARQMRTQADIQDAYTRNTDPTTGELNQGGALSQIGKINPMARQQLEGQLAQQNEAKAKAQAAQLDAAQKTDSYIVPAMNYIAQAKPEDQPAVYNAMLQQLKDKGVDTSRMEQAMPTFDPAKFDSIHKMTDYMGTRAKDFLENQKVASETAQAPAKLATELYGSRSPVSTVADQYTKEDSVSMARKSQVAANQMLDNYKHPSPQGDASLVLNAFKIKFPTAPDVNSLKELGESQATIDQWKNLFAKSTQGGFDQATRDNLMRDGISTYRANVDSQRSTQGKYQDIAQQQGLPSTGFLKEPAIDKTYAEAMKLQDKIGPYVKPSERGGGILGMLGLGGKSAQAAPPKIKPGTVEDGHVFMGGNPGDKKNWKPQ